MGVTPSAKKTFPAVAKRMAFVTPDQVVDVATEIIKVQRDFGNRADRKVARLKYLIHDWGLERFKAKVEEYYGQKLADPHPRRRASASTTTWAGTSKGDGRWFYGLNVENGRIADRGDWRLKEALREICTHVSAGHPAHAASEHSVHRRGAENRAAIGKHAAPPRREAVAKKSRTPAAGRWPAWPGPLAACRSPKPSGPCPASSISWKSNSPGWGCRARLFTLRMTGCPNGCARPYNCDIGLVGKTAGKYTIFVGGRLLGDRLNFIYKDLIPRGTSSPTLVPLFVYFKQDRQAGETFGDFCHRSGAEHCWPGRPTTRRGTRTNSREPGLWTEPPRDEPILLPWMQRLLRFAAGYNLLAGASIVVFVHEGYKLLGIAKPLWSCPFNWSACWSLYGVGYWLVAVDPLTNRNLLLLGFWSKLLGPALGLYYVAAGKLPWTFVPIVCLSDLVYLPPFLIIIRRLQRLARQA